MALWRLVPERHADQAFSGEGAKQFGGRWNLPGTRMVYSSTTLSLATLELLVHLRPEDLREGYVFYRIDVPTDMEIPVLPVPFKEDWRQEPPSLATQELGSAWIRSGDSALLQVPSILITQENNVLLNPEHTDFHRLTIHGPELFRWDSRIR